MTMMRQCCFVLVLWRKEGTALLVDTGSSRSGAGDGEPSQYMRKDANGKFLHK